MVKNFLPVIIYEFNLFLEVEAISLSLFLNLF